MSPCIRACDALTPLGNAAATAAAVRAGVSRLAGDPLLPTRPHDLEWEPWEEATSARIPARPDLPPAGAARLLALAHLASRDLTTLAGVRRADLPRCALLLGLPEVDAVTASWGLPAMAKALAGRLALDGLPVVESHPLGRTAAIELVDRAGQLLAGGQVDRVLLVVADSLVDPDRHESLDTAGRVRSSRSPAGMMPGEAGAGLVLTADGAGPHILGTGHGRELQPIAGPTISTGSGLQQAIGGLLPDGPVWALPDLTGEDYRAREWGLLLSRLSPRLNVGRLTHPASSIGDCGAAGAAVQLAIAATGLQRGWAGSAHALVTAAADDGRRSAALLGKGS